MNNSSLIRYENDGIELIINTHTGESFATTSGYARMANLSQPAISKRINSTKQPITNKVLKGIEIHTQQGIKTVNLITEDLICEWLPKDNPSMATQLLKLGVRSFLHKLAGYEIKSTAVEYSIPQTLSQALFEAAKQAERAELAEAQNKVLVAKIEEDAPKVALAEAIAFSNGSVTFNEYAKIIGTGHYKLFRAMRDCGVIMKSSNLPYQKWIDLGFFEVSEEINAKTGQVYPYALVTGKGQIWLKQRLDRFKRNENNSVAVSWG